MDSPLVSMNDCFSINIHYAHLTISSSSNAPKNLTFKLKTSIFNEFKIPNHIVDIPNHIVDLASRDLIGRARNMVLYGKLEEMTMFLRMVSLHIGEEDQFDRNHPYHNEYQIVGLPSYLEVLMSSYYEDQCSVCFEEFRNGSQIELFYTKCKHVFHKECIAKWIVQCVKNIKHYTCPLCRCDMI